MPIILWLLTRSTEPFLRLTVAVQYYQLVEGGQFLEDHRKSSTNACGNKEENSGFSKHLKPCGAHNKTALFMLLCVCM